mmetsp:Transcript_103019/g.204455  ORF Transcript_103019/g.204455 Transcript_103019/m.204455 type:complete len:101 (-) Transcript_103019:153-455(-)
MDPSSVAYLGSAGTDISCPGWRSMHLNLDCLSRKTNLSLHAHPVGIHVLAWHAVAADLCGIATGDVNSVIGLVTSPSAKSCKRAQLPTSKQSSEGHVGCT